MASNFKEKYINDKEKNNPNHVDKTVLSDDAFAIGEVVEELIFAINKLRKSLNG